jgi:hypothetical protein
MSCLCSASPIIGCYQLAVKKARECTGFRRRMAAELRNATIMLCQQKYLTNKIIEKFKVSQIHVEYPSLSET